ncbi:hypothetical protein [Cohnella sp. GCM10027633]|uniref:hypothetical protein n=1 Tax=unclassified Cohnella TaxID=2636738 RepID=UPI00364356BC
MNKAEFMALLREQDGTYDDELQLIRTPMTATYHTALKQATHPLVHMLLEASVYALRLLEAGDEASAARAIGILRRVVSHQDRDPSRDTYGIWPYYYEESLDEMDRPDWNMADFHGKQLCLALRRHADRLPADLVADIREAIGHACRAIMKRNVGPGYTNIAIMGAFVTLAGGELLGKEEFRLYGLARLERFYRYTMDIGTFSEYNSPCYTPIAIRELHAILTACETAEALAFARELTDLAWEMAGSHYHAPTAAWGGPHSRTYASLVRPDERRFLEEAMLDETFEYGENIRCPERFRPLFSAVEERSFSKPTLMASETGYQVYATLYQNEAVSLGTYSQGVMWNQRRNLIGYVDAGGKTAFVQLQFLMNGRDFCSAMYTGAQDRTRALIGFNLLTDNGAWHSDLDIINGRFRASDLRIRLLIGGETEGLTVPVAEADKTLRLRIGEQTLAVRPVYERYDEGELKAETSRGADGTVNLDYVIYAGQERKFDFHAVERAAWLFALSLDSSGQLPDARTEEGEYAVTATLAGDPRISIETAIAPGKTQALFAGNQARHPAF